MNTHTISSHYLSAVVNNDYSGLEKLEIGALNTWLANAGLSFADPVKWEDAGYCTDEVSGLKSSCHNVTWRG